MQQRRRAPPAERRLRSAAPERARQVSAFSLLKEDDEDQEDADEDVDDHEKHGHEQFSEAPPLTGPEGEFFPDLPAPSRVTGRPRWPGTSANRGLHHPPGIRRRSRCRRG